MNDEKEHHYQIIFYLVFKLQGQYVEAEVRSARGYLIPYSVDGRRLVKVGASFDKKERNIGEWKQEVDKISVR